MPTKFEILKNLLIVNSESEDYNGAIEEWKICDKMENEEVNGICLCTHTGLRWLYTIENKINNTKLFPIGSKCIKQFKNERLGTSLELLEKLNKPFKCKHSKYNGCLFKEIMKDDNYINFIRYNKRKAFKDLVKTYDLLKSDKYKHLLKLN